MRPRPRPILILTREPQLVLQRLQREQLLVQQAL
jgi:hypothetical protein